MFTIVNMSKATLCNSLERVTEAVPKVQYNGYRLKTDPVPVSVTTSVPTHDSNLRHPVEASFVITPHPGPGTEANLRLPDEQH